MGRLKTESEVFNEGFSAAANGATNEYAPNTWAYIAWQKGWEARKTLMSKEIGEIKSCKTHRIY